MAEVGDVCVWFKIKKSGRGLERKITCRVQKKRGNVLHVRYWNESLDRYDIARVQSENIQVAKAEEIEQFFKTAKESLGDVRFEA